MCEKCPNSELLLVFIFPYLKILRENADQKKDFCMKSSTYTILCNLTKEMIKRCTIFVLHISHQISCKLSLKSSGQLIFNQCFTFIPPEKIRKPEVFLCFQEVLKLNAGSKSVILAIIVSKSFIFEVNNKDRNGTSMIRPYGHQ